MASEQHDELVVHNFYQLLAGCKAFYDLLTKRLFLDPLDKGARDLKIDVCFEQRAPDLAQGLIDIALGDAPLAAQIAEDVVKALA